MHKGQIPKEHYPMIQNLELNRHLFENNVRRRVHKLEEFNFQLIDDEKCAFYDDVGEVCQANWYFLAQFEILDTETKKEDSEKSPEETKKRRLRSSYETIMDMELDIMP